MILPRAWPLEPPLLGGLFLRTLVMRIAVLCDWRRPKALAIRLLPWLPPQRTPLFVVGSVLLILAPVASCSEIEPDERLQRDRARRHRTARPTASSGSRSNERMLNAGIVLAENTLAWFGQALVTLQASEVMDRQPRRTPARSWACDFEAHATGVERLAGLGRYTRRSPWRDPTDVDSIGSTRSQPAIRTRIHAPTLRIGSPRHEAF